MASLSLINFTCDFGCFLYGEDAPQDTGAHTQHLFAGKKRYMKNVGFIGWRGMVGSGSPQRMVEERDFDAIRPVFFSTSQFGQAAPAATPPPARFRGSTIWMRWRSISS